MNDFISLSLSVYEPQATQSSGHSSPLTPIPDFNIIPAVDIHHKWVKFEPGGLLPKPDIYW